jgi:hypothetical protein
MVFYGNAMVSPLCHWGKNPSSISSTKISILLVFFFTAFTLIGCATEIPTAANDLAVSALCDFPPFSGNNMCRRVEVTHVYQESNLLEDTINTQYQNCWCVELLYIDFTGEIGSASVWVVEAFEGGEYQILKGPLLAIPCFINPE